DLNFQPSFSESPSSWVVRLKTLSPKIRESLSEIVIWFDRKDYSVSHLEMFEPGGDCTKINFTDKKINQPVDDEKFLVH
ncbi:MAG: outer-membrane lipoprotein carrier protein LolA, partial [Bacteroidota bacterium]